MEPLFLLKGAPERAPEKPDSASQEELGSGGGRELVCAACGFPITREGERMSVNGQHRHVFFNPHGIVYELGSFLAAPGIMGQGVYVAEFSWFAGFRWQIALCRGCGAHMGWRFADDEGGGFHGLILNMLEARDDGQSG